MRNYEVSFIVDPTLSNDEVKAIAQQYVSQLESEGCKIVHIDEIGLRQLAYPINKRHSGVYYCVEFSCENGDFLTKLELNMRRDERLLRYLTVRLDKFGVKYNEDKRAGKIGKRKPAKAKAPKKDDDIEPIVVKEGKVTEEFVESLIQEETIIQNVAGDDPEFLALQELGNDTKS